MALIKKNKDIKVWFILTTRSLQMETLMNVLKDPN